LTDKREKRQIIAVIDTLEEILTELDEQQLFLPALKIVEALEALGSSNAPDLSADR
jgi:hypothetical protein